MFILINNAKIMFSLVKGHSLFRKCVGVGILMNMFDNVGTRLHIYGIDLELFSMNYFGVCDQ